LAQVRLVTYRSEQGICAGVQAVEDVLDAGALLGERPTGARRLIEEDRLDELRELAQVESDVEPATVLELLAPVPDPDKIICLGLNYRSHTEEQDSEPPDQPTFFAKFPNALAGPDATVTLPTASEKVDYEGEVAFVIGRRCNQVDPGEALDAVAGYMLFNDLSARDLQFATPQWMPGKVFDDSAPCGPALVTPDEAGPPDEISFTLDVNGERRQEASTSDMVFSVPDLVARLSHWMTLVPGDIISTGTPAGVGSLRQPRIWLQDGDEILISSPTLGELRTTIAR
jgi:2-keto-4-pentenoate hydratase/2-oxohepta-3-ene-1,7-dioic acid hydratase in catechol pathway